MRYGSNIALITAAHGAVVSDEKHVNKCWHGEVQVGSASPVAAIIKDLDPRQFANEIVAHALCRWRRSLIKKHLGIGAARTTDVTERLEAASTPSILERAQAMTPSHV
jgi:hypothetical protein